MLRTVEINITPRDLAEIFHTLAAHEKAQFLNEVGQIGRHPAFTDELVRISTSPFLKASGVYALNRFAETAALVTKSTKA